jgi:preprotein translocase subunit SecA
MTGIDAIFGAAYTLGRSPKAHELRSIPLTSVPVYPGKLQQVWGVDIRDRGVLGWIAKAGIVPDMGPHDSILAGKSMDFLETIGDFFVSLTAMIERLLTRLFGASNERLMRRLGFLRRGDQTTILPGSLLDKINQQEAHWQTLSDERLKETASEMRARLAKGETLDDLLPDSFAAVREAGRRYLKMRHYDVQMIGGYVLHKGMISEMVTGEGKTLVATLPAFLNALAGHVHVVTVNDYLARRDMEWMGPLYMGLGLTVGCIQSGQDHEEGGREEKIQAYQCDITYGTNNEFGFDYLRDNMKTTEE